MLLGGAPLDGPRHIWWNFVSSSRERIERAKLDWREDRFAAVPGDAERIPLPERPDGRYCTAAAQPRRVWPPNSTTMRWSNSAPDMSSMQASRVTVTLIALVAVSRREDACTPLASLSRYGGIAELVALLAVSS